MARPLLCEKPSAAQAYLGGTVASRRLSRAMLAGPPRTPSLAGQRRGGGLISFLGARCHLGSSQPATETSPRLYFQRSPPRLHVTALPSYAAGG